MSPQTRIVPQLLAAIVITAVSGSGYVAPKSEWTGYGRGGPIP
jgi:hypothetical protein